MKTMNQDWTQYRETFHGRVTRVFRGPNGWYVATEDKSGTHHQPASGGSYATAEEAWAAYREQQLDRSNN